VEATPEAGGALRPGVGYTLGVDIGTTYSAAAVTRRGRAEIVALGYRSAIVPSAVFVTADGTMLVGEAALRRGATEPERLARHFKRRIGDSVPLIVGGSPLSAEALTARVLRTIVETVEEQQGGPPSAVAVTLPANWGPFKRDRFGQTLRLADLGDAAVLTEPEAAATAYAAQERVEPGAVIAVYDLGGGTFDATVLRRTGDGFDILGSPEGIERLGGIDVDEAVFAHVRSVLTESFEAMPDDDPASLRAVARLRDDCVDAKEALSSDTQVSIPVVLPGLHTEVRLSRGELEDMVRPTLADSVTALRRAIDSGGLQPSDIDRVLLVGGSSRMPLVAALVSGGLGRPVTADAHPKHVVALGAALAAARVADPTVPLPVVVVPPAEVAAPARQEPPEQPEQAEQVELVEASDRPAEPVQLIESEPAPLAPPTPPERMARRRRLLLGAGALVAAGAIAGAAVALSDGSDDPTDPPDGGGGTTTTSGPPPVPVLTAGTPAPVGASPDGITSQERGLWVASIGSDTVTLVDPASGGTIDSFTAGDDPLAITNAFGSIWVTNRNSGTVSRLDPATGDTIATIDAPGRPAAFGVGTADLWVVQADGTVSRIDPDTNEVTAAVPVTTPAGLAVTDEAVWASSFEGNEVVQIDPNELTIVDSIATGANPDAIALGDGVLWVTNRGDGTVSRIDLATREAEVVDVGTAPAGIALDGDRVWVIDNADGTLVLLDAATGAVQASVPVGGRPLGLVVTPGVVWVTLSADDAIVPVSVT
jgi:YVTN family beta-propeller protein